VAIEAGHRSLETEVYNYKKRPQINYKAPPIQRTFKTVVDQQPIRIGEIRIKPFSVDHSVLGAAAFLIYTSDATIAYTGDFRLHGVRGQLTQKFIEKASSEDVDILLCEGSRIDETETTTEDYVAKNALEFYGC